MRLVRGATGWRVTAIHPSRTGAASTSRSAAAREILANPRIDLPPAARADVLSGQVHDSALHAMLTLSRSFHLGISVVRSGHPIDVFGTTGPATTRSAGPSTPGGSTGTPSSTWPRRDGS